ncbi:hypothetical protein [Selenomonas ruminantium]|uniref:hypothetical protein n=1 Tax=Selenomonas ruminantium TaxID=971 RepID=UPI001161256F|nr:hypothetical protein [Selenomonas ruminantium]
MLMGLWLLGSVTVFAAEKLQFVDAVGPTGYYVDVNSIAYTTEEAPQLDGSMRTYELVQARVAVVKARTQRRYTYLMQFNKEKMVYRIISSKVQAYDTKEVLEKSDAVSQELPFVETSPMQEVVDYIYAQSRGKKRM